MSYVSKISLTNVIYRQNRSSAWVVNTFLSEFDGLEGRNSVYVIVGTTRFDMVDPAVVHPGRLDKLLDLCQPSNSAYRNCGIYSYRQNARPP